MNPPILGITGPPGAGKSTIAAAIVDAIGADARRVGTDGFHLAHAELIRLARVDRKGAPDTFDALGYTALLRRLPCDTEAVVYAHDSSARSRIRSLGPSPSNDMSRSSSPKAITCSWTTAPGLGYAPFSTRAGTSISRRRCASAV